MAPRKSAGRHAIHAVLVGRARVRHSRESGQRMTLRRYRPPSHIAKRFVTSGLGIRLVSRIGLHLDTRLQLHQRNAERGGSRAQRGTPAWKSSRFTFCEPRSRDAASFHC